MGIPRTSAATPGHIPARQAMTPIAAASRPPPPTSTATAAHASPAASCPTAGTSLAPWSPRATPGTGPDSLWRLCGVREMTARTILEHTDDVLALPAGTWLVATAAIWGMPEEGRPRRHPDRHAPPGLLGDRRASRSAHGRRPPPDDPGGSSWRMSSGSRPTALAEDATLLPNKLRHLAAMLDRGAAIRLEPADMSMLSARFDAQVGAAEPRRSARGYRGHRTGGRCHGSDLEHRTDGRHAESDHGLPRPARGAWHLPRRRARRDAPADAPLAAGPASPASTPPARAKFTGEVRFNEQWLDQPLRWRRPRRIFVCAHGDLFHEAAPDERIHRVFAAMALAPQHTFQVLTKRPERAACYLARRDGRGRIPAMDYAALMAGDWPLQHACAGPAKLASPGKSGSGPASRTRRPRTPEFLTFWPRRRRCGSSRPSRCWGRWTCGSGRTAHRLRLRLGQR